MSRSYLYRSVQPNRPITSALLFAAWVGGALVATLTILSVPSGGDAGAAEALRQLIQLVAAGAVVCGLLVVAAELAGNARFRDLRLLCAGALVLAGMVVSFGVDRRENVLHASDVSGAVDAVSAAVGLHSPDVAWLALGLVAALAGLVTAVAVARQPLGSLE